MNEHQILKEHQISKQTQIMNESKILKENQICRQTQITNEPQILKEPQIINEPRNSSDSSILVTLHLPRGGTVSPGPQRNFWNMGFHFLTPIFNFLSKPEPNARLVVYSMITSTWARKTHFDKNPKEISKAKCKNPT